MGTERGYYSKGAKTIGTLIQSFSLTQFSVRSFLDWFTAHKLTRSLSQLTQLFTRRIVLAYLNESEWKNTHAHQKLHMFISDITLCVWIDGKIVVWCTNRFALLCLIFSLAIFRMYGKLSRPCWRVFRLKSTTWASAVNLLRRPFYIFIRSWLTCLVCDLS